jgi:hypothetical protein
MTVADAFPLVLFGLFVLFLLLCLALKNQRKASKQADVIERKLDKILEREPPRNPVHSDASGPFDKTIEPELP